MSPAPIPSSHASRLAGLPSLRLRRLVSVRLLGGHRLSLHFRDGFIGELDLLPWLTAERSPMSDPLLDEKVFEQVFLDDGVLTWSHGFDIDPTSLRLWAEDGWCR